MSMMDLLTIVDLVINDCKAEWEFEQFNSEVHEGRGWEWIFSRPRLKGLVVIPAAPAGDLWPTDQQVATLVHHLVVTKGWNMHEYRANGHAIASGNVNFGRSYFFKDLVRKLGRAISANRYVSSNPAAGKTFAAAHETGITVTPLPHGGGYAAFQLSGSTSSSWAGLQTAGQKFLAYMDVESDLPPSERLSKITKGEVDDLFYTLDDDSGNSCLVGVMVADILNEFGQTLRVVSFTANMCRTNQVYVAHTNRKQDSQIHMEIFQFERLGQLLQHILLKETISAIDVGILGMKTSKVVSENSMCDACRGTKITQLDNSLKGKVNKLKVSVDFLSIV